MKYKDYDKAPLSMTDHRKKVIVKLLEKLSFVMWDRHTDNMVFFGWIDREDKYKDFVVLDFGFQPVWFITSSAKYSAKISEILNQKHYDCKRVENFCGLSNTIKLIKEGEKVIVRDELDV